MTHDMSHVTCAQTYGQNNNIIQSGRSSARERERAVRDDGRVALTASDRVASRAGAHILHWVAYRLESNRIYTWIQDRIGR